MHYLKAACFAVAGVLVCAAGAQAQERILNGNMSNFGAAPMNDANVPGGWTYSSVPNTMPGFGPVGTNSPFTNRYASNNQAWQWVDEDSSGDEGYVQNNFAPYGTAIINFDFNIASIVAAGTWGVQFNNEDGGAGPGPALTIMGFRIDDDFRVVPTGGVATSPIALLSTNTWYNVQAVLDVTNSVYSGTITPFGSAAIPFSGVFVLPGGTDMYISGLQIRDRAPNAAGDDTILNSNITFDNISVTPEPASLSMLGLLGIAMLRRRR